MAHYPIAYIKPHFLTNIAASVLIVLMVINDSFQKRALLMILALVLVHATLILFGVEYDKLRMEQWKKHEKEVIEGNFNSLKLQS